MIISRFTSIFSVTTYKRWRFQLCYKFLPVGVTTGQRSFTRVKECNNDPTTWCRFRSLTAKSNVTFHGPVKLSRQRKNPSIGSLHSLDYTFLYTCPTHGVEICFYRVLSCRTYKDPCLICLFPTLKVSHLIIYRKFSLFHLDTHNKTSLRVLYNLMSFRRSQVSHGSHRTGLIPSPNTHTCTTSFRPTTACPVPVPKPRTSTPSPTRLLSLHEGVRSYDTVNKVVVLDKNIIIFSVVILGRPTSVTLKPLGDSTEHDVNENVNRGKDKTREVRGSRSFWWLVDHQIFQRKMF